MKEHEPETPQEEEINKQIEALWDEMWGYPLSMAKLTATMPGPVGETHRNRLKCFYDLLRGDDEGESTT